MNFSTEADGSKTVTLPSWAWAIGGSLAAIMAACLLGMAGWIFHNVTQNVEYNQRSIANHESRITIIEGSRFTIEDAKAMENAMKAELASELRPIQEDLREVRDALLKGNTP